MKPLKHYNTAPRRILLVAIALPCLFFYLGTGVYNWALDLRDIWRTK